MFTPAGRPRRSLPAPRPSIPERFAAFHAAHPEVYAELRRLALDAVTAGRQHLGIGALWEVLRWNLATSAAEGGYKLNNDLRASYSALLSQSEPALSGVFEMRRRRS